MADFFIRQRDYLLDISRALTSQLSLNEVLRRILRAATKLLGAKAGLIALAEAETLDVRASYGIQPALLHLFAPLLTDIPREDPDHFGIPELNRKMRVVASAAGLGLHQVIALPMVIGQEMVGVIYIFRADASRFSQNDVRLLQSFADQAAIAVHNARLYEQVMTDKQRLDALLRHSADGIMILAANYTIESVNLTLARMTGVEVDATCGMHHDEVIRWARREPGQDLTEATANGWPFDRHSTLYVEGDLRHISRASSVSVGITYAPLFGQDGRLHNVIANIRDITKFREAEEAKSTFVSVISHELKTPVSLIKGYASTLRRDDAHWDEATVRNGLKVIEEEADRLAGLIENLLDVTRVQAGTLSLQIGPVDVAWLIRRQAEKFGTQTDTHAISVVLPDDLPAVQGDEQRLVQVIANLLSNAIKYSPGGGAISISAQGFDNRVEISVSDEGIGMPADQLDRVFERFHRVDNALTRETQGAGLGLYIVRSIVEAHGGRIGVESQPGQGTTFTFSLPLYQG